MYIIPAIDLIGGKLVRLTKGNFHSKKNYPLDPLETAKSFEAIGIRRLHLVDLDGARSGKIQQHHVLEKIASQTNLQIDFGGGIQDEASLHLAFDCGASQVTAGTIAVLNPSIVESWFERYGPEKIILGMDVKKEMLAVKGWQESTRISWKSFLESYHSAHVQYVVATDISKDGNMQGPALGWYQQIRDNFPGLKLIASGGVSSLEDLENLAKAGCYGAITGKALYEGAIDLSQIADKIREGIFS